MMTRVILLAGVALLAVHDHVAAQQPGGSAVPPDATAPADPGAQVADGDAQGTAGLEDIVVVAQRRNENLQNVPVAVSAVTSAQLAKAQVLDVVDLRVAVPTLNVTNSNGYLTSSLRGIGSNGVGAGIESPVALYVDGVYIASQFASALSLNNIAQIEVLKGPQGTLFGRNATGGLIQVLTRDPMEGSERRFSVSYGNYKTVSASAYVAEKASDTFAIDLAIQYRHQGEGFGRNTFTGRETYQLEHDFTVRSKAVYEPTDATRFTLIGDYSSVRDTLNGIKLVQDGPSPLQPPPGSPPFAPRATRTYDLNSDRDPSHFGYSTGASLRWEQDIGTLNLSSLTSYRRSRYTTPFDFDLESQTLLHISPSQVDSQFSQELQLSSDDTGRFKWLAGLFYFDWVSRYDPLTIDVPGVQINIRQKERSRSFAGFAQASYEIFENTTITLGGRYTSDKRSVFDGVQTVSVLGPGVVDTIPLPDTSRRYNKFTWRASLDHRFSDEVLGYVSANRGFRAGGFAIQGLNISEFEPETLDAYEVGLKMDLFDRRLRLNLAGFYYDYQKLQVQVIVDGGFIAVLNGTAAEVYGLDLDATLAVTDELRLTGGLGLISPFFEGFPNCPVGSEEGNVPVNPNGDCSGNQLPLAAKTQFNIGADYTVDLGDGRLNFNGTAYHNSGFFFESDNRVRQPSFWTVNGSITWTLPGENVTIGAFAKNLTDEKVLTFETTAATGYHTGIYAPPRTYGVSLGYKF